jgi:hypothetical protein
MPYLLLIMEQRDRRSGRSPETARLEHECMTRFAADLERRGVCRASESLRSLSDAVRIRVRDGQRLVSDGPFAESKEIVGGFFLLDCRTMADAVAIAGECPAAEWATLEVREIGPCNAG